MPKIVHEIWIDAPIELCFDLARDVGAHTLTTSGTRERAVGGVTTGLLQKGESVTWEAVHFGVKQRLTARITEMERPFTFTDVMVKGAFASFTHVHEFVEAGEGTIMRDVFEYRSPLGWLGRAADYLFLQKYMTTFIASRPHELKRLAERGGTRCGYPPGRAQRE
ncbi:cell division protein [Paenibacillus swuensis]|uniref:Cell division protein n=1 Tax=Paenibacillus swuensis TaxID=1178515 RepID=A0A172TEV6_9BACL|nr:SRPBCC family protein [Paenibacillus swuensis]ANE45579.1 cell division protein [Paenibacillus swuensis]